MLTGVHMYIRICKLARPLKSNRKTDFYLITKTCVTATQRLIPLMAIFANTNKCFGRRIQQKLSLAVFTLLTLRRTRVYGFIVLKMHKKQ